MTGWKTAMSGNVVIALLRILPPILDMIIAESTGVQPVYRMSHVFTFLFALSKQNGAMMT